MQTVVIPTVGLGSRLAPLTDNINKSLLPYKNKPIISYIIENFDSDTRFIIPIGYNAQQVKDFLTLSYGEQMFTFVYVDNYNDPLSGPGSTMQCCKDLIDSPFWYIPCDTYFEEILETPLNDTVYYKDVPENLSDQYTMLKLDQSKITDLSFKKNQTSVWVGFTGVMYIKDYQNFFKRLTHSEIVFAIENNTDAKVLNSWIDLGNLEIYKQENFKHQNYDFTKTDELTVFSNNKVLKWYKECSIPRKKYLKYKSNTSVYPNNVTYTNNWLAYDFSQGKVVYKNYSLSIFKEMLNWLDIEVWKISKQNIYENCIDFYKNKTYDRINKFLQNNKKLPVINYVNETKVKQYEYYLNEINWEELASESLPSLIHGDLHFDNVIYDTEKFKIIDWRHDFGGSNLYGDTYYDLAKLLGGLIIDYSQIKNNNFSIKIENDKAHLNIPKIKNNGDYIYMLKDFVISKGWSYKKTQQLVPIIYWNMAPLHIYPFNLLIWYLGIEMFEILLNGKDIG